MRSSVLLIAALLCLPVCHAQQPAAPAAQQATATAPALPVIKVQVNLVQVPVLVLYPTHDKVATFITPDRFTLSFDHGPFVKVANARMEGDDAIDMAIVVDARGAQGKFLPELGQAIANMTPAQLRPQDHVSIYAMTCGSIRQVLNIPADPARLKTAVDTALTDWNNHRAGKDKSPCNAAAPVFDVMAYAANGLSKAAGRRVMLAFTNGDDKGSTHNWSFVAAYAQDVSVSIFALNADSGTTRFSMPSVGGNISSGDSSGSGISTSTSYSGPNAGSTVTSTSSNSTWGSSDGRVAQSPRSDSTLSIAPPRRPTPMSDSHDMVVSALEATTRKEPVFRLTDLCELSGGVELRIDKNDPSPALTRAMEMIRNRYILDFPRRNDAPGYHDLKVAIDSEHFFIRPAGNGVPVALGQGGVPAGGAELARAAVPSQPGAPAAPSAPPALAAQPVAAVQPVATATAAPPPAAATASPAIVSSEAANAPAQEKQPAATLKATARLVYVDVVVRDKNGRSVQGLKAGDFTLQESGKAQTFQEFQEHRSPTVAELAAMSAPKTPPGTFTNVNPMMASDGPLNVLLLDRLNTPITQQSDMQKQILAFLSTMRAGQRIAIFDLAEHLVLLQGFTDDPELLRAAVQKGGLFATALRTTEIGGEGTSEDWTSSGILAYAMAGMGNSAAEIEQATGWMKPGEEKAAQTKQLTRAQYTMAALNALVQYLAGFPGRKNLLWFSGSFPVSLRFSSGTIMEMNKEQAQAAALFSRSQIAVYPIDANGLTGDGTYNAANWQGAPSSNPSDGSDKADHDSMKAMADDTGGKAVVDTNDLRKAVEDAIDDGSNYYTIAYTPSNTNWDGRFRQVEVKLSGKTGGLSYRRGYMAQELTDPSAAKPMRLALMRGGPEPTQILFTTHVQPVSAVDEAAVAENNKTDAKTTGPYRRYQVEFSVDPKSLLMTTSADGHRHVSLEFMAYVYGLEGAAVNTVGRSMKLDLPPGAYEQYATSGVPFKAEVSVPAKGNYTLRLAVHDAGDDHVGAVEVPVAAVSGLAPLEASAAK